MAGIAAAHKSYFIGPQDGWVKIVVGGTTVINFLRMSAYPHTHPFQVGLGATAPTDTGITVCHHPFKVFDTNTGIGSTFWVKVNNPSNQTSVGRMRIDVYSEGGVLQ